MIKSYRTLVATVFLIMSLLMLKSRLSLSSQVFTPSSTIEALGIEEKEILFATLERLEKQKKLSKSVSKIDEALTRQTLPVWIAKSSFFSDLSHNETKLILKEGVDQKMELIIPMSFFKADPISQEISMGELLSEWTKYDTTAIARISKQAKD